MKFGRQFLACLICLVATPAFAQEREWTFDTSADEAFLVFGVPETDDVGISFWCKIKSGSIHIFLAEAGADLRKKATLRLIVGKKSYSYSATASPNEDAGTMSVEAQAPAGAPVFKALQQADSFVAEVKGAERSAFPLSGADFEGLVSNCT